MAYQDLSQPMSLAGLSGTLGDNIALLSRARQRGFQAAANGDLTSSLSEAMARPDDDALTEALYENGASVKSAPDLPKSGILPAIGNSPDLSSLNSLSSDQLSAAMGPNAAPGSVSPTQQNALNSITSVNTARRRKLPASIDALGS